MNYSRLNFMGGGDPSKTGKKRSYSRSVPKDTSFGDGRKVEHGMAIRCDGGNRLRSTQEWQEEALAVGRRRYDDPDMLLRRLDRIFATPKAHKIGEVTHHGAVRGAGDRRGNLWTSLNL